MEGTYPSAGTNEEATHIPSILRCPEWNESQSVDNKPDGDNDSIQNFLGWLVVLDNRKISMNSNRRDEETRRQITIRVKEPLYKTSRVLNEDAAFLNPSSTQKKCGTLVHIGKEEVEHEDEKLIWRIIAGCSDAIHPFLMGNF